MALTRFADNSQSATLDTEHVLSSPTSAGYYQLMVDLNAMVVGDILRLKVKIPARNGGTKRIAFEAMYGLMAPGSKIAISPAIPVVDDSDFTLEQTDGTGRSYPWAVIKSPATLTRFADDSQTAVINTEHNLSSPTAAGYYQLIVDLNAMVNADVLVLRVKSPARNGGTKREVYQAVYGPVAPGSKIAVSPPIPIIDDSDFTLQQVAGTGRAYPWAVIKAV